MGFVIILVIVVFILKVKEAADFDKNKNGLDYSSFDSLPSAPPEFLKQDFSEKSLSSDITSSAFSGGFKEESGFNDPSISFLPQETAKPARTRKRVNLKRQESKTAWRKPETAPAQTVKPSTANINRHQILERLTAKADRTNQSLNFTQNDILKAFVMQELLQKHDLNKIFERVPNINRD